MNRFTDDFIALWFGINDLHLGVKYPKPLMEVEVVEEDLP